MTRSIHPVRPLDDLLADVERAFEQGRGSERASDLAEAYPEHAETLVDFVDAMLRAALAPSPDPVASARTTAALADHLDARGRPDLAAGIREAGGLLPSDATKSDAADADSARPDPATPAHDAGCPVYSLSSRLDQEPTARRAPDRPAALGSCLHEFVQNRLGLNPRQLADRLRVPFRFLRGIDENPSTVPTGAVEELVDRVASLGLEPSDVRTVVTTEPEADSGLARAASGIDGVRSGTSFSYRTLVEQCFRREPDEKAFWLSFED